MSATELWLQQPIVQAVGWALLQFVWQGALIALFTAIALAALRRSAPDVRYVVATIALSVMITMPVVTAVQALRTTGVATPDLVSSVASDSLALAGAHPEVSAPAPSTPAFVPPSFDLAQAPDFHSWIPLVVLGWFIGVVALTIRLISAWLWVQRMRSHGTALEDAALQSAVTRLARRLHLARRVGVLQSAVVDVPTVIGWLKPVVLLPVSTLAGLSPQQIEAILAHELAHIRRHDYIVNLLQTAVETMLFYHPAVWWLSRRIRAERENCCDDLAVNLCGDPFTYARALADLEELRGEGGQLVMAASGGSLLHRVRRIIVTPDHAGRGPGWLAGGLAVALMLAVAAGVAASDALQSQDTEALIDQQLPPAPPTPPTPPTPPADPPPPPPTMESLPMVPTVPPVPAAPPADPMPPADAMPPVPAIPAAAPPPMPPVPPVDPVPSVGPVAPAPPIPPVPPDVAAPRKPGQGRSSGNYTWSNNNEKLQIQYEGEFEFTDDDTDVKRMAPGSFLRIKEGGWFSGRSVEFRADDNGTISRRFWNVNTEKPFDPEGRQWLSQVLPRFIRQSGFGAPGRVQRILKAKGPSGVLAEISLIDGGWAKRLYFAELLKTPLDPATAGQVLAQAGREIESDYELATLLISAADRLLVDEPTRAAYLEAAKTIQSDYEMRRVYSAALERRPVNPRLIAGILDTARNISSDYEQASLLVEIAKLHPIDSTIRQPFFTALDTIASHYERARVLTTVVERDTVAPEVLLDVIRAAKFIRSNYESSQVLLATAERHPLSGAARDAYIDAAGGLGSYEQGRVLTALVKNERRGSTR